MFVVIHRATLQRMIQLVREDRKTLSHGKDSPLMRLAAQREELSVSGHEVEATFPATVYESGVIFIRTTLFRRLLDTFNEETFLTLQADKGGLHMGNVFLSFDAADMVLFPLVEQAPLRWPVEMPPGDLPMDHDRQATLFED